MITPPHPHPTPPPWARADSIGYPAWQRLSHPGISAVTTALLATGGGATAVHDRHMSFVDSLAVRTGANGGVDADDPRVFRSAARAGTAPQFGAALRPAPRAAVVHASVLQARLTPHTEAAQAAPDGASGVAVGGAVPAARGPELVMRSQGGATNTAGVTTAAMTPNFSSPEVSVSTPGIDRSLPEPRVDGGTGPMLSAAASTPATAAAAAAASSTEAPVALSPPVESLPDTTPAQSHAALVSAPSAAPLPSLTVASDSRQVATPVVLPTTAGAFAPASSLAPKSPVARVHRSAAARKTGGEGAAMPTSSPAAVPGGGAASPAMPDLPAHGAAEPAGLQPATVVPAPVNAATPTALPASTGRSAPAPAVPFTGSETRLDRVVLPVVMALAAPAIDHLTMSLTAHTLTPRSSREDAAPAPALDLSVFAAASSPAPKSPVPRVHRSAAARKTGAEGVAMPTISPAAVPGGGATSPALLDLPAHGAAEPVGLQPATAVLASGAFPVPAASGPAPVNAASPTALPAAAGQSAPAPAALFSGSETCLDRTALPVVTALAPPPIDHLAMPLTAHTQTPRSSRGDAAPALDRAVDLIEPAGSVAETPTVVAATPAWRSADVPAMPLSTPGAATPSMPVAEPRKAAPSEILLGNPVTPDAIESAAGLPRANAAIGAAPIDAPPALSTTSMPSLVHRQAAPHARALPGETWTTASRAVGSAPAIARRFGAGSAAPGTAIGARPVGTDGLVLAPPRGSLIGRQTLLADAVARAYQRPTGAVPAATPASIAPPQADIPGAAAAVVTRTGDTQQSAPLDRQFDATATLAHSSAPQTVRDMPLAHPRSEAAGVVAATAAQASLAHPAASAAYGPDAPLSLPAPAAPAAPGHVVARAIAAPPSASAVAGTAAAASSALPLLGSLDVPITTASSTTRAPDMTLRQSRSTSTPAPDAASFDIARVAAPLRAASGALPSVLVDAATDRSAPDLVHRAVASPSPSPEGAAGRGRPETMPTSDAVPTKSSDPGSPIALAQPLAGAVPLALTQRRWWADVPGPGVSGARAAALARAPAMPLSLPQIARTAFEATDPGDMGAGGARPSLASAAASSVAAAQPRAVSMPLARRAAVDAPAAPIDRVTLPMSLAVAHPAPALAELLMPAPASTSAAGAGGSGRGAAPAEIDVDDIVERAWRAVLARLAVDQERRGFARWA